MKSLFWIWVFLLLGALAAAVIQRDTGYVVLSYDVWTVEMSLSLLLLIVAAAFLVLYLAIRFWVRLWRLPAQVQSWNRQRGLRVARRSLTRGLLQMAEGNWAEGERLLVRHADRSETPLLNYLAAARAAQLQGEHERRDRYLKLAHDCMPAADVAVGLTQAELQLAHHQAEQALATLTHLRTIAPKHSYVLRLLARLYEQLGDWEKLRDLLPQLRRGHVLSREELTHKELRIHRALLEQAFVSIEPTRLQTVWQAVPKSLRHHPELVTDYAGYLFERSKHTQAEAFIRDALKREWNDRLISLYGQLESEDPGRQLGFAEGFLERHPQHAGLLLALGRLSLRARLWGKARGYLEAAMAAGADLEAARELGRLLEHMGDSGAAMAVYRRGLLQSGTAPLIPLPEQIGSQRSPQLQEPGVEPPPPHGARPAPG